MAYCKRDMEERLAFVRFWVNYMKTHSNKEWSGQQASLVNSILRYADKSPELYNKVKARMAQAKSSGR